MTPSKHKTTGNPADSHEFHIDTFTLDKFEVIAAGESFVQLSGGRNFLYLVSTDEHFQFSTAIYDLATNV